jgi:ABC-type transport system substrate-binding protein/transcriptional regulator with XRE-family HTH domain
VAGSQGDNDDRERRSFGYQVRRRRLALDLTQAALARRVGCSTATIKKIEQEQRRPSRTMARRLAEGLQVPDGAQAGFVAVALGERPAGGPLVPGDAPGAVPDGVPAWLLRASTDGGHAVVGRSDELATLTSQLEAAVRGEGRVVLVTGEAGQGKTALLRAFAGDAHATVPELVVGWGACTAVSGAGDPYLPFRDVLAALLVDPRARWLGDRIDPRSARSLWAFAPEVASTMLREGPHLVGTLAARDVVQERLPVGEPSSPPPSIAAVPSRDQLVAELTSTLQALADQRPLLVLLDDLQWIDPASAELLFHLSRRLAGARVLLVGAYRPSEVGPPGSGDGRSAATTLHRLALELQHADPTRTVDLDALDEPAARRLCGELLVAAGVADVADVPDRVFEQTRGHPLFVRELVADLRRRGALAPGADGRLVPGPDLDWGQVPHRIGVVLEQRLGALSPAARAVLDVAAVVGERFGAEVVAGVLDLDHGSVLRTLERELQAEHGVVVDAGTVPTVDRWQTMFRFTHALFQHHLLDQLGRAERRHLHGAVARELAALDRDDELVTELAYHATEAGDRTAAIRYRLRAGDRARGVYASDEAIGHYEAAVDLLRTQDDQLELGRALMKLGLTHQLAFDHARATAAYDEAFGLLPRRVPIDHLGAASATLRMAWRDPPSLDPTLGGYTVTAPVTTQLFRGLVRFGPDLEVLPDLAERFELEAGGTRYVFHLRDDACWSDGAPLTARDVEATLRRALDPRSGATVARSLLDAVRGARSLAGPDPRAGTGPTSGSGTVGVEAVDDTTLVIDLEEPTSYFIHNLAYYVLQPTPTHVVARYGDAWAAPATLVGSGPFVLAEWEPGVRMVLHRNPHDRGGSAGNVERVELDLGTPGEQHAERYRRGQLDVLTDWFTPLPTIEHLLTEFPQDASLRPAFTTFAYAVAAWRPPLDDVEIRRAMAMAVDRSAVAAVHSRPLAFPSPGGVVPPGLPAHDVAASLPFDPAAARDLVARAGGAALTIGAASGTRAIAEVLHGAWLGIGLDCRIEALPEVAAPPGSELEDVDVLLTGWIADYPDPDNFLRVWTELTLPRWHDVGYRDLLRQASRSARQPERLAAYQRAGRILAERAVLVPLFHRRAATIARPWVSGFRPLEVKHPGAWEDVVVGPRTDV